MMSIHRFLQKVDKTSKLRKQVAGQFLKTMLLSDCGCAPMKTFTRTLVTHISCSQILRPVNITKCSSILRKPAVTILANTFIHGPQKDSKHEKESDELPDSALNCRLAAENGFLSFTRNGYISCVAASALLSHAHNGDMISASILLYGISWMCVFCGTSVYMHYLVSMRKRVRMLYPTVLLYLAVIILHFCVYTAALTMFISGLNYDRIISKNEPDIEIIEYSEEDDQRY